MLPGMFARRCPVLRPSAGLTNLQTTAAQGDITDSNSYPLFATDSFRLIFIYQVSQNAPECSKGEYHQNHNFSLN